MIKKVLAGLIVVLLLVGCGQQETITYGKPYLTGKKGQVVAASATQVSGLIERKNTFVVYIGTIDCDSCKQYKETLQQLIDNYPLTMVYLPADDDNEKNAYDKLVQEVFIGLQWTPTTFIIKDGQVADFREKTLSYDQLQSWLLSQDMISGQEDKE